MCKCDVLTLTGSCGWWEAFDEFPYFIKHNAVVICYVAGWPIGMRNACAFNNIICTIYFRNYIVLMKLFAGFRFVRPTSDVEESIDNFSLWTWTTRDVGCRIRAHQTGWKVIIDIPSISGPTNCWLFTFWTFLVRPWTLLWFLQLWSDNEKHCQWTFYMHRLIWIRKKVRKTFQFLQPLPTFWLASIHFSMNRFNWQVKIWKRNIVTWTCRRLAASLLTLSVVTI